MRVKKNGERYFMDLSTQEQAVIVAAEGKHPEPTPRQMLLDHMNQALGYLEWFVPRCKMAEALPVVTARAALRNLIEYLERNK